MASLFVATTPGEQSNELHRIAHAAWLATRENRHAPWLTWMTWTTESLRAAASLVESARGLFPNGLTDGASREFAWLDVIEKAVAAETIKRLRAGDADAPKLLLDLARTHAGKWRFRLNPTTD